jgi:tetratricopeptide (TPR) repeat protein
MAIYRIGLAGEPERAIANRLFAGFAGALREQYERTTDPPDLRRALKTADAALRDSPDDPAARAERSVTLGQILHSVYQRTGDPSDLEAAIARFGAGVDSVLGAPLDRAHYLNSYALSLADRFDLIGDPRDADASIAIFGDVLGAIPLDSADLPGILSNLARVRAARFAATRRDVDRQEAVRTYRAALTLPQTAGEAAVQIANAWGRWASSWRAWGEASEAYERGIDGVDVLFRTQGSRQDKETWLRISRRLADNAAYAMSRAGDLEAAVTALERGRALLFSEALRGFAALTSAHSARPSGVDPVPADVGEAVRAIRIACGSRGVNTTVTTATELADDTLGHTGVVQRERKLLAFTILAIAFGAIGDLAARQMVIAGLGDDPALRDAVNVIWSGERDPARLSIDDDLVVRAVLEILADPDRAAELMPEPIRTNVSSGAELPVDVDEATARLPAEARRVVRAGIAYISRQAIVRGNNLADRGDRTGAERAFQDAIRIHDPDHGPQAEFLLGCLLQEADDVRHACLHYRNVIDSQHQFWSPMAAVNLGFVLKQMGDAAGAQAAYRAAIDSGHSDAAPQASFNLGNLLREQHDPQGARLAYERAIASGNTAWGPKAAVNLGTMLLKRGELGTAIDLLLQGQRSDDVLVSTGAGRMLQIAYAALGISGEDLSAAHAAYEQLAASGQLDFVAGTLNLGLVLLEQGDDDGGQASLQRTVESGHPGHAPRASIALATILERRGDAEGAKAMLRAAIDSCHEFYAPTAALKLGTMLEADGDQAAARTLYEQAISATSPEIIDLAQSAIRRLG